MTLTVLCQAAPVCAQSMPVRTGSVAVDAAFDVVSRYLFRGHQKDERGAVFQPSVGIAHPIGTSETGWLREVSAGAFVWSSVHAWTRVYPGDAGVYELDAGASLDATLSNGWTAALTYTAYLAPTDAFDRVHEIGAALDFGAIGGAALTVQPRLLVALEIDDAGGPEDAYLEAGAALVLPSTGSLQWTIPLDVGMSIDGYYRDSAGDNVLLGFLSSRVEASVSFVDLGIQALPGGLIAGAGATFINRNAGLAREPRDGTLWTTRIGLTLAL